MSAGYQASNSFKANFDKAFFPVDSQKSSIKQVPNTNKRKSVIINSALATCSIAIGIAACLILDATTAKIRDHAKQLSNKKPIIDTHKSGWYELKPNQNRNVYFGNFKYKLITDSNGFRVGPRSIQNKKNQNNSTPTLFLLGDSFTYGSGLNWDKTYPGILEKNYNIKVVNAGAESYSPTPHRYILRNSLNKSLLPTNTIVIMAVDISDVQDESTRWKSPEKLQPPSLLPKKNHLAPIATKEESTAPPRSESTLPQILASFASKNLPGTLRLIQLARHGTKAMESVNSPHNSPDEQVLNLHRSAFTHTNWNLLEDYYQPLGIKNGLQKIKDEIKKSSMLAHKNGLDFYLLAYPWPAQVYIKQHFDWVKFLRSTCQKPYCNGVINTFPNFSPDNPKSNYFFGGDMHFNPQGNQILATSIARQLALPPLQKGAN